MSTELEIAGIASASALTPGDRRAEPSGPCPNCGYPTPGKHCPDCGQLQSVYKRPLFSLILDGLRDSFALDGRIMRTLPKLFLKPGRMTRQYLDGERARFVPPFRLYLLSSLIFFLALFSIVPTPEIGSARVTPPQATNEEGQAAETLEDGSAMSGGVVISGDLLRPDGTVDREKLEANIRENSTLGPVWTGRIVDFANRIATAYENETLFITVLQGWAPRISFLQLPIFALLLALMYFWRRSYYMYDHLITALHLQSFLYLATTVAALLAVPTSGISIALLVLITPFYLYRQLRVTYGDGRILAVLRTLFMLILVLALIVVLAISLVLMGLYQL